MTPLARRLSAVFLLAVLSSTALPGQTRDGVDILLGKARSLEARGRIDLAAQNWNQVLLVDPNQTEALAGLARHAKQNGDANSLRVYLERLRKANPRDPAIAAIERMRVLTPQDRARLDEAGRLAAQKRSDEAMKIYREVFGNEPPWGKWSEPFYDTLATRYRRTRGRHHPAATTHLSRPGQPGLPILACAYFELRPEDSHGSPPAAGIGSRLWDGRAGADHLAAGTRVGEGQPGRTGLARGVRAALSRQGAAGGGGAPQREQGARDPGGGQRARLSSPAQQGRDDRAAEVRGRAAPLTGRRQRAGRSRVRSPRAEAIH